MASRDEMPAIGTPLAGSSSGSPETYCPICGKDASDPSLKRFGEYFCSEAHVVEYAREVRAKQATGPAAVAAVPEGEAAAPHAPAIPKAGKAAEKKGGLAGILKMAACCGAPLLALLFLAGGGGAVLGAAGAVLPFLLFLACPIGMYFMMRGMRKQMPADHGARNNEARGPKSLPPDDTGKSGASG